jgi:hypothetical protein
MDGFVADYISSFTAEIGRQHRYEEYAQIMTGFTPDLSVAGSSPARPTPSRLRLPAGHPLKERGWSSGASDCLGLLRDAVDALS